MKRVLLAGEDVKDGKAWVKDGEKAHFFHR
jgi:hypothetical protein